MFVLNCKKFFLVLTARFLTIKCFPTPIQWEIKISVVENESSGHRAVQRVQKSLKDSCQNKPVVVPSRGQACHFELGYWMGQSTLPCWECIRSQFSISRRKGQARVERSTHRSFKRGVINSSPTSW